VRDITLPAMFAATTSGIIIGSSRRPELVAVAPWTVCWNRGR
jgi:hypothetical protein